MAIVKLWGKAVIFLAYKDSFQISNIYNKFTKVQKILYAIFLICNSR